MSDIPTLLPGTVLGGRFEIHSTLGRGGFSIAYSGLDLAGNEPCVIKELFPTGAQRQDNVCDLTGVPSTNPKRLRERFLNEANLIGRLRQKGILRLRDCFEELGTAYYVTDLLEDSRTLDRVLTQEGRLAPSTAMGIFFQLMEILEGVHEQGILHRDLKPTNILLSPKEEVFLIDFGAAREWHADSAAIQTVLFTPGYAPLEQLSARGKRGPATDIYALCATAYHMLAGFPPRSATERADGIEMTSLSRLRPDLDQPFLRAIHAGLQLHFRDRPQSMGDLRAMLIAPRRSEGPASEVESLDSDLARLKQFSYSRNECPVCGELLERPKPLRVGQCPVCRNAPIKSRRLAERLCPHCKNGVLHRRGARTPLLFCPKCKVGRLDFHRAGLMLSRWEAECPNCPAVFDGDSHTAELVEGGPAEERTWEEWLEISGRTKESWICDLCDTQYDVLASGRRRQIGTGLEAEEYYPDEWARIAARIKADAGNACCRSCGADYWIDPHSITMLSYLEDPYHFGERFLERRILRDDMPYLAAGKPSGNPGLVCPQCETEFDFRDDLLALASTPSARLAGHRGETLGMENWHRLAQGLPLAGHEVDLYTKLDDALRMAFHCGDLPFGDRDRNVLWSSGASEVEEGDEGWTIVSEGTLTLNRSELTYSRILRKWKAPLCEINYTSLNGDVITLAIAGELLPKSFEIAPIELVFSLESGERSLTLGAASLHTVLERTMSLTTSVRLG